MKNFALFFLTILFFGACSTKNQFIYLNDSNKYDTFSKIDYSLQKELIKPGDILKIDVQTIVPEAALPYNILNNGSSTNQIDLLKLEGYLVDDFSMINFPVLGKISVAGLSDIEIETKITSLLLDGNHLTNPNVKVRRINSRFTILGEVSNPGTFSYYDQKLNIFQAIGYAGDLTIYGKRNDVKLIREENGINEIYNIELTQTDLLNRPIYYIKNNDIIIVSPTYNRVKSAGFIGTPSTIASIVSLLLSVTILLNNN